MVQLYLMLIPWWSSDLIPNKFVLTTFWPFDSCCSCLVDAQCGFVPIPWKGREQWPVWRMFDKSQHTRDCANNSSLKCSRREAGCVPSSQKLQLSWKFLDGQGSTRGGARTWSSHLCCLYVELWVWTRCSHLKTDFLLWTVFDIAATLLDPQ